MNKLNFRFHLLPDSQNDKRDAICFETISDNTCIGIGFIENSKTQEISDSAKAPKITREEDNQIESHADSLPISDASDRNTTLLQHTYLIDFYANQLARRLPAQFEIDDLMSAGMLGLIDAIEKFDPTREVQFKTYAGYRIYGAMLDELRVMDWTPRSVREHSNQIKAVANKLEQQLGRPVKDEEIANALEIEEEKFQKLVVRAEALHLLSLDMEINHHEDGAEGCTILDTLSNLEEDDPQAKYAFMELKQLLTEAINALPERERLLVSLYYYEEMNMKEISQVMEISESRVSQIHANVVASFRECFDQMSSTRNPSLMLCKK